MVLRVPSLYLHVERVEVESTRNPNKSLYLLFERPFGKSYTSREVIYFYGSGPTGSRTRASQPSPSISDRLPPCASAIWRLRTSPIPEPPGLVVKKGTKRLAVSGRPNPSSRIDMSTNASSALHATVTPPPVSSDASAALRMRLMSIW